MSGRGLCDGLITRPEESYRLWRVVVCYLETSKMRRLKPATGLWKIQPKSCNAKKTKKLREGFMYELHTNGKINVGSTYRNAFRILLLQFRFSKN